MTVAGPYRDEDEGRNVEAALISALDPQFNAVAGHGPKFVPIGVPPELSDRPTEVPLALAEIGQRTGGALVVYLSPGDYLSDGRPKFDPADPADAIVQSNIQEAWEIGRHLDEWLDGSGPHVLVGVHGRVSNRFVAGAAHIDTSRWRDPDLMRERGRYCIPLVEPVDLDACKLRGRKVSDAKFGQFGWQLHKWVDGRGRVLHPPSPEGADR